LAFSLKIKYSAIKDESDAKNIELTAEDTRELGRLRRQKGKWDSSIIAALHIGMYCAGLEHPIIRAEFTDEVYKINDKIPDTTIDIILRAIPKDLRKDAGRVIRENKASPAFPTNYSFK